MPAGVALPEVSLRSAPSCVVPSRIRNQTRHSALPFIPRCNLLLSRNFIRRTSAGTALSNRRALMRRLHRAFEIGPFPDVSSPFLLHPFSTSHTKPLLCYVSCGSEIVLVPVCGSLYGYFVSTAAHANHVFHCTWWIRRRRSANVLSLAGSSEPLLVPSSTRTVEGRCRFGHRSGTVLEV